MRYEEYEEKYNLRPLSHFWKFLKVFQLGDDLIIYLLFFFLTQFSVYKRQTKSLIIINGTDYVTL